MFLHFIRKLARDCSGVGFIELALTAPLLALLFLGMIDLSSVVSTRIDLEQAAQRTTDYALAKRPPNGNTSYLVNEAATEGEDRRDQDHGDQRQVDQGQRKAIHGPPFLREARPG